MNRFPIRHDTKEEREEFLKKRAASRKGKVPTEVAPLPEQTIAPPRFETRDR
jgi:hypothetical protein